MAAQRSDVVDYRIVGDDLQLVEVELDPGETVIGEAGAMTFLDSDIEFETKMGDGADPDQGLWGRLRDAGKRALAQESIFLTHFTNRGRDKHVIAFSAEFPGKIVPMDLGALGGELWRLARAVHEACLASGAESVVSVIKVAQAADGAAAATMEGLTGKFRAGGAA